MITKQELKNNAWIFLTRWRGEHFLHLLTPDDGRSSLPILLTEAEAVALSKKFTVPIKEIKPFTMADIHQIL